MVDRHQNGVVPLASHGTVSFGSSLPVARVARAVTCALGLGLAPWTALAGVPNTACGDVRLDAGTHLALVGSYNGVPSGFAVPDATGHDTGELRLLVAPVGKPIYLVLNAYEPTIWRIGIAPAAEIKGVTVFGYYDQVLVGVPTGVPVVKHVYERDAQNWDKCLLAHSVYDRKHAIEADSAARVRFGKGFDSVAFSDEASNGERGLLRLGPETGWPAAMSNLPSDQAVATLAPETEKPIGMTPGQWELIKLADEGYVRRATVADLEAWKVAWQARMAAKNLAFDPGPAPLQVRDQPIQQGRGAWYVAKRPPHGHLPDDLAGSHSVTFIVDPALLAGSLSGGGHSTFYYVRDGSCLGPGPEECRRS